MAGARATAELKRLFVEPGHRGRGLARALLADLETRAVAAGIDALVLETGSAQPEALTLYANAGYTSIPSFGYYRDSPENRCLGRLLVRPRAEDDEPG